MSRVTVKLQHGLTALFLVGLSLSAAVTAQDVTHPREMQLPEPAFERPDPAALRVELDNGLTTYVAEDHRAPLVTITAFIGVGSGHGDPGDAAALAAALRRGPADLSEEAFARSLDAMNAQFAVTQGHEETEVFLDVPAEDAWKALRLLGELLKKPAFAGNTGAPPPRAASGSIDYNYSLVSAVALFEKRLFDGHQFGRLADAASVANAASKGARALHKRFVVTGNVSVALAGDFRRATAVSELRRSLSAVTAGAAPDADPFPSLMTSPPRTLLLETADRDQGWVVIGHELPVVPEEDEAALAVMDYILGAYHLDSRLYRSSRELRGLTNDNSSFLQPGIRGPGSYTFRTYGRPEAVRLLVDVTFRELQRIRETTPTADELFVAQGALVDGIYAERYATGVDATRAYAREWLRYGSHTRSASYPARVSAVSIEDVKAAANKYIHPERMTVAVVGPLERIEESPQIESEPQLDTWGQVPGSAR